MCPHRSEGRQEGVSCSLASHSSVAKWERVALRSHYITPLQGRRGQKWWPLRQEGVRWGKAMDPSYFQPCTEHKDAQS